MKNLRAHLIDCPLLQLIAKALVCMLGIILYMLKTVQISLVFEGRINEKSYIL